MNKETLFQSFPVPTYEQWREAAEKSLKGAAFDAKLLTKTYEGITLQPIYRQDDVEKLAHIHATPGEAPYLRGTKAAETKDAHTWEVCQEIVAADAAAFNRMARYDLERGQTMLNIVLDRSTWAGLNPAADALGAVNDRGLSLFRREDVDTAFAEIDLEIVPLYVDVGPFALPFLSLLLAHADAKGRKRSKLRGCIGADPLGAIVTTGTLPYPLAIAYDGMASTARWAARNAPMLKTILVQGHPYHDAGASAVQELAYALSTGVEYVQAMLERGLDIEEIAPQIQFAFSVGSNSFMEIAKIRAARMLWTSIIDSYGGSPHAKKMTIHARTSAWTKTALDPHVNLLRATTEAFSAVVGGADSLHVSAFDEAIQPAGEFSRRIARNTQLILKQEAHLGKVTDPAGGSWYVEWLTDEVAKKAWDMFLQVEEQGGMLQALLGGEPQAQVEKVAGKKAEDIASRKKRIVGTNMYANPQERPEQAAPLTIDPESRWGERQTLNATHDREAVAAALANLGFERSDLLEMAAGAVQAGATLGELTRAMLPDNQVPLAVKPLRRHRAGESFEKLRQRAYDYEVKNGHKPTVFLANIGPVSRHKARADFAAEFFAVGGFEVLRDQHFSHAEEAARAAAASLASITVICSDDDTYPGIVPALAQEIKAEKPNMTLLLAGLPAAEQLAAYKSAGLDDCIHARSNCYEVLRDLQERIGVIS